MDVCQDFTDRPRRCLSFMPFLCTRICFVSLGVQNDRGRFVKVC